LILPIVLSLVTITRKLVNVITSLAIINEHEL